MDHMGNGALEWFKLVGALNKHGISQSNSTIYSENKFWSSYILIKITQYPKVTLYTNVIVSCYPKCILANYILE